MGSIGLGFRGKQVAKQSSLVHVLQWLQESVLLAGSDVVREVLLTVRLACSELADMHILLHNLASHLPEQQAPQQADERMGTEHVHAVEERPGRVAPTSVSTPEHARPSPAEMALLQQKAEKWKTRCHDLRRELAALSVEATARDATLQVHNSHSTAER